MENNIWKNREQCRLCNSYNLTIFLKLQPTPQANHFIIEPIKQDLIPLDVSICQNCKHIQLIQILNPSYQYLNYSYVSSASKTMVDHLISSIDNFIKNNNIKKNSNILEIGANDGTCIKYLLNNGYTNIIGVDPAKNINKLHNLPIICDFFGSKLLNKLKEKYSLYNLIYSFHCCAHIEDIQDVFKTVYNLLDDDGIFIMEVGYFYEVFKNKLFDTIYHEHIDYHTCTAIKTFGIKNNLLLYDVNENNIQGGSVQFLFSKNRLKSISDNVFNAIKKENDIQLFNIMNLQKWQNQINLNINEFNNVLNNIISSGGKIAGYGASAKSTTFLHHYKLRREIIEYIIDDSIYKHNYYTPGLHIPIKPLNILDINNVDYIIILSGNYTTNIINNLEKYIKNGLKIIIPFPEIKII
jgi:SAM-dependent methyltransferase